MLLLLLSCSGPSDVGNGSNPQNEGTPTSPVLLTLGVTRVSKVGTLSDSALDSYYQFTTTASFLSDNYQLTVSNFSPATISPLTLGIYPTTNYVVPVVATNSSATVGHILNPNTTYYIDISNIYNDTVNVTFDMVVTGPS